MQSTIENRQSKIDLVRWSRVLGLLLLWFPLNAINARSVAATVYFDNEVGNDSHDGTSRSQAKKTLAHLTTLTLQPGDVVDMAAPSNAPYIDTLRPPTSGTAQNKITFRANATKGWVCNPNLSSVSAVERNGKDYIVIDGLEATRCKTLADIPSATGWELRNIYAHNTLGANDAILNLSSTTDCLVQGGRILDSATVIAGIKVGTSLRLTIDGVEISDLSGDGIYGGNVNTITIQNCNLHDYKPGGQHEDGINLWGNTITIRYNRVVKWTQLMYFPLFDVGAGTTNFALNNLRIYGNELHAADYGDGGPSNGAPGIYIDSYSGTQGSHYATRSIGVVEIYGNTFGYCGLPGIRAYAGTNTTGVKQYRARNNVFFRTRGTGTGNGGTDVQHGDGSAGWSNRDSDYNCFYQCTAPAFEAAHSITSNPLLASYNGYPDIGGDLALQSGSPTINTGDPNLGSSVTLPSPYTDRYGVSRSTSPHDMGAYEYVSKDAGSRLGGRTGSPLLGGKLVR